MWCVIIPTYNNSETIYGIVSDALKFTGNVIVVNDGSTDGTSGILQETSATVVEYKENKGKGHALKKGFAKAREMGFKYAITIDADGQHFADDIPVFLQAMQKAPGCLIVGSRNLKEKGMPRENTFANRFSNFWFTVQTGIKLPDTQTGYRLYPLEKMGRMRWLTSRYEAELEMLVYAAWKGIGIISVPIKVYYPQQGRVTHFRPIYDFFRITCLNIILCFLSIVYGLPSRIIRFIGRSFHLEEE